MIKKVAEARARKRKRAVAKLKAAKKQAALMAENSDLSEREKVKAVAKAARNLRGDQKARKVYVATKRTKSGSVGQAGGSKVSTLLVVMHVPFALTLIDYGNRVENLSLWTSV